MFLQAKSMWPPLVLVLAMVGKIGGIRQVPCAHGTVNIPYVYSAQWYTRCGSSRIVSTLVLNFTGMSSKFSLSSSSFANNSTALKSSKVGYAYHKLEELLKEQMWGPWNAMSRIILPSIEIPSLTLLAFMMNVFEATCLPAQHSELIYWQLTQ